MKERWALESRANCLKALLGSDFSWDRPGFWCPPWTIRVLQAHLRPGQPTRLLRSCFLSDALGELWSPTLYLPLRRAADSVAAEIPCACPSFLCVVSCYTLKGLLLSLERVCFALTSFHRCRAVLGSMRWACNLPCHLRTGQDTSLSLCVLICEW